MMDNTDQRLAINDMNGQSVLMSNMELLPNMSVDDQLMQLVMDNPNYMMPDNSHLVQNQRSVNPMESHSVNSGQNAVESCNYVTNQYDNQYHSSNDSHRYKYRSSGLSSVSETVTHVSETDSSLLGQNYGNVGNINVQQSYQMSSLNNWSQNQNHNNLISHHQQQQQHSPQPQQQQSHGPKDIVMSSVQSIHGNHNQHKVTPHSAYIPRQRISNFVPTMATMNPSTTSTPVNQTHNNMVVLNNNHNNIDNRNINKNHSQLITEGLVQTHRVESPIVQKRTVIIFKVIDQIVDSSGKVIKETVIKNEEIIKNLGKGEWNDVITPLSSISNVSRIASNPSSTGVLADVSSSVRSTGTTNSSSIELQTNNENNNSLTKTNSVNKNDDFVNKTPNSTIPPNTLVHINTNYNKEIKSETVKSNDQQNVEPKISEKDEEERRETATALLSLTQRSINIDCNQNDINLFNDFSIKSGNKVMAKWRDKNYYPAIISKHLPQNNKWSVIFEDRATRSLFETELIQLSYLVKGQDVMVTISDGFCAKAIITDAIYESKDIQFDLQHLKDNKMIVKRYQLKDVFLNVEQSANICSKSSKPLINGAVFADVDLDNIVCGKRVRQTVKSEIIIEKSSQQFRNGKRRATDNASGDADYVNDEEELDEDKDYGYKTKKKSNIGRNIKKKAESHNIMINSEHSLSISPRTSKVHSSMPAQELIKLLGPLPEPGSQIFESLSFLLTCGDRNSGDICSEQSNPERSTPFDKSYLTKQIETGGGKVFESFEEMKNFSQNNDMLLIADTYHRSIKYIQCLAAGISIASHLWVIDCCRQNKYLKRDNYSLPAGFSIITNALPSDKNTFKKSAILFKGTKFYFGSKTPEKLHSLWAPVLSAAQAVIVNNNSINLDELSRKSVDIIIGDTTCSVDLVKKAKQVKIPVVSSEYIVQCLINGRKLSYDASPLFSYTYKNNL
ncbi:metacaspase-2-like [Oppia nitens]|uniref:metacaspase-2-like n=1 Tax=Oppia nitens TaxID=1686743 RepID=UPI0023DA6607|nr:metacaspase-2-like [Oppia nitens]